MYQGDNQKCRSTYEQDGDACGWAEEKRKPRGQHHETKHNSCQVRWVRWFSVVDNDGNIFSHFMQMCLT